MERKDLLHHCRYYKGEKDSPFPQTDIRFTAWRIESLWVNQMIVDSDHINFCIEEYILRGMNDFQKFDDTPIALKALLMNRYFQYSEREDIDAFKDFYLRLYN